MGPKFERLVVVVVLVVVVGVVVGVVVVVVVVSGASFRSVCVHVT